MRSRSRSRSPSRKSSKVSRNRSRSPSRSRKHSKKSKSTRYRSSERKSSKYRNRSSSESSSSNRHKSGKHKKRHHRRSSSSSSNTSATSRSSNSHSKSSSSSSRQSSRKPSSSYMDRIRSMRTPTPPKINVPPANLDFLDNRALTAALDEINADKFVPKAFNSATNVASVSKQEGKTDKTKKVVAVNAHGTKDDSLFHQNVRGKIRIFEHCLLYSSNFDVFCCCRYMAMMMSEWNVG